MTTSSTHQTMCWRPTHPRPTHPLSLCFARSCPGSRSARSGGDDGRQGKCSYCAIKGSPPASASAVSGSVRSDIIIGLGTGTVGGVAILRWFLACLQESFTILLTLLMPLRRRAMVTTCLRKVKHRITAPLPVPRLAVPPLALTVSTRMPMFARMPPS